MLLISDDDECSNRTIICEQICVNEIGSFHCLCNIGYLLASNQVSCESKKFPVLSKIINFHYKDIDECLTGNHSCEQNCSDTDDSYICHCYSGFQLNAITNTTCDGK